MNKEITISEKKLIKAIYECEVWKMKARANTIWQVSGIASFMVSGVVGYKPLVWAGLLLAWGSIFFGHFYVLPRFKKSIDKLSRLIPKKKKESVV